MKYEIEAIGNVACERKDPIQGDGSNIKVNVGIIGIGGVGGYFGGKIARAFPPGGETRVHFVARGDHLAAIKRQGLFLDTDEGEWVCEPSSATADISELPKLDICVLCVKSYDLDGILAKLKDRVDEDTLILPLLNGVDIPQRIRRTIREGILFPSCVYVGTRIEKPGKVTQRGGGCIIHLGGETRSTVANKRLIALFERVGIKYSWHDDPRVEIWNKFLFIASFGLVTARYDRTIGETLRFAESSEAIRGIMNEIYAIAKKMDIPLQPSAVEEAYAKGSSFPPEATTSFQRDYKNTVKPDERDLFGGAILRMGASFGVPTNVTASIYAQIERNKP